jgi:membrane protein DedA with SNARE-associated domain
VKEYLFALVGSATGIAAYGVVFLVLLAAGFGLPLPEDIPLVAGGVLVHEGKASLWAMMLTGYLGIIVGDSVMFMLGRRLGPRLGSNPRGFFGRIMTAEKRARVEQLFKKHGEKIVMIARFLPGVRAVTYFTAGSVGMRYARFMLYDSIAALGSAPLFVYLGYYFGADIDAILERIARGERNVLIGLVVVALVVFLISRWRARREAQANAEALKQQQETAATLTPPREQTRQGG